METRTAIFSKLVRDFMRDVPLAVAEGTPLGEAAQRMEAAGASSATVTDARGRPRQVPAGDQKKPRAPDHE